MDKVSKRDSFEVSFESGVNNGGKEYGQNVRNWCRTSRNKQSKQLIYSDSTTFGPNR